MILAAYIGFYIAVTTTQLVQFGEKGCRVVAWDTPLFLAAMFALWPFALAVRIDRACRHD